MTISILFQFRFLLFFFLLLWLGLPRLLNKNGKSGHPCFVSSDLRGNSFSFSPLSMMLGVSLAYMACIILCSLYVHFLESFVFFFINGCEFCQKILLSLLRWSYGFNSSVFFNVVYHIDWFVGIGKSLHLWDKILLDHSEWSFYYIGFSSLIFFEYFCNYVHQSYWPVILFFCGVFVWFWYQGNAGSIEWIWKCSSEVFENTLRRIGVNSSNFW